MNQFPHNSGMNNNDYNEDHFHYGQQQSLPSFAVGGTGQYAQTNNNNSMGGGPAVAMNDMNNPLFLNPFLMGHLQQQQQQMHLIQQQHQLRLLQQAQQQQAQQQQQQQYPTFLSQSVQHSLPLGGTTAGGNSHNSRRACHNNNNNLLIWQPSDQDVLMGRGAPRYDHPGNKRLRELAIAKRDVYKAATSRDEKTRISWQLVHEIQSLGGKFLEREEDSTTTSSTAGGAGGADSKKGPWKIIKEEDARKKAADCLREAVNKMGEVPSNKPTIKEKSSREKNVAAAAAAAANNEEDVPKRKSAEARGSNMENNNLPPPPPPFGGSAIATTAKIMQTTSSPSRLTSKRKAHPSIPSSSSSAASSTTSHNPSAKRKAKSNNNNNNQEECYTTDEQRTLQQTMDADSTGAVVDLNPDHSRSSNNHQHHHHDHHNSHLSGTSDHQQQSMEKETVFDDIGVSFYPVPGLLADDLEEQELSKDFSTIPVAPPAASSLDNHNNHDTDHSTSSSSANHNRQEDIVPRPPQQGHYNQSQHHHHQQRTGMEEPRLYPNLDNFELMDFEEALFSENIELPELVDIQDFGGPAGPFQPITPEPPSSEEDPDQESQMGSGSSRQDASPHHTTNVGGTTTTETSAMRLIASTFRKFVRMEVHGSVTTARCSSCPSEVPTAYPVADLPTAVMDSQSTERLAQTLEEAGTATATSSSSSSLVRGREPKDREYWLKPAACLVFVAGVVLGYWIVQVFSK